MKYSKLSDSGHRIGAKSYELAIFDGIASAKRFLKKSAQEYHFFPGGSVNSVKRYDEVAALERWQKKDEKDAVVFTRKEKSVLWKRKETSIVCRENSIEIFMTVEGSGEVGDVRFARCCVNGSEYGFAGEFDEVVNTAPDLHGRIFYHPVERFSISAGGDALSSCCSCIALRDRTERKYLTAGSAAVPGEYTWDSFSWNPAPFIPQSGCEGSNMTAGGFSLEYSGKKTVEGTWETPRLILGFCDSFDDILPTYLKECYAGNYLPRPHRRRIRDWWRSPIYCTWHDQVASAMMGKNGQASFSGPAPQDFCTEELAEEWLEELIRRNCKPGIIIIDDKWQLNLNDADPDPEKFPDMRAWIEKCHARGIKVFLRTALWNNDGIHLDEAVTRDGKAVCGDITNPKYEARFREMLRRYFSDAEGCLNADGIKVDGLTDLPTGAGLKNHDDLWGLELQKRCLDILYETVHQTKKDACVSTAVANPYLSDTSDMVRFGEMYHSRLDSRRAMQHRAEVYSCTMPYTLIDTAGQFNFSCSEDFSGLVSYQMKYGIPSIGNAKYIRCHRFFQPVIYREMTDEDYDLISRAFRIHRSNNGIK